MFFFCNFVTFFRSAFLVWIFLVSMRYLFCSLNFWWINSGNIFGAGWSFFHVFLVYVSILFLWAFNHIVVHLFWLLWSCEFLTVLWTIFIAFRMALLLGSFIIAFSINFSFRFCRFLFSFLWLVTLNIIFHLSENFLIDRNRICIEIQMALLRFADPWLSRDHTEVGGLRVDKALLFLEIGWFDWCMIGPSKQLEHRRVGSSVFGGFTKDFVGEVDLWRISWGLLL